MNDMKPENKKYARVHEFLHSLSDDELDYAKQCIEDAYSNSETPEHEQSETPEVEKVEEASGEDTPTVNDMEKELNEY